METNLPQSIEAILFATAEPQTYAILAQRLHVDIDTIAKAVDELTAMLEHHGIHITALNEVVSLSTRSEHAQLIESIRKDELSKDLSKASAETLAVVAYTPGVTKTQIEFIRGVNVSYSLRSLLIRGLIETKGSGRSIGYYPTVQLLQHFGVENLEQLPEYTATKAKLSTLLQSSEGPQS